MQKRFQEFCSRHMTSGFGLGSRTTSRERMREGAWSFSDGSTLCLEPRGAALTIRCIRGTTMVTQESDPTDHILQPGEVLVTRPRGLVVVWALSDSEVASTDTAQSASPWRAGTASPTAAHTTLDTAA